MMSLYFFTGIFFTLSLNAFFTQLANDFVAGVLSIVGGVISSVVVAELITPPLSLIHI